MTLVMRHGGTCKGTKQLGRGAYFGERSMLEKDCRNADVSCATGASVPSRIDSESIPSRRVDGSGVDGECACG